MSDGLDTPEQIVEQAVKIGLRTIAITDHDAVQGVPAAQQAVLGIDLTVIPGVELSTVAQECEIHVLGYFIDITNAPLLDALRSLRDGRLNRAQGMLSKLDALGMPLAWDQVQALSGAGALGRPHIAAAMIQAGYVDSTQEAFNQYLGRNGSAFVPRYKIAPEDAIALIREAGGIAALAHPWYVQHFVPYLAQAGLAGIEAYYSGYTAEMSAALARLAKQNGLVVTCGSDYHGLERLPNNPLGGVAMPRSALKSFLQLQPRG